MPGARYIPGGWFAVARSGTVVLLGPETRPELLESVWSLLAAAPEAHEVLHTVTDAFGVSLSRIPPFGIIDAKDSLRVFLRGELELTVELDTGTERLSGRDVTTWTERRISGAASYRLSIGQAASLSVPGAEGPTAAAGLPLGDAVVLLSALSVSLTDGQAAPSAGFVDAGRIDAVSVENVPVENVPAAVPGEAAPGDAAAAEAAPVETVLGFDAEPDADEDPDSDPDADADLGLTIAPGQSAQLGSGLSSEEPAAADAASVDGPDVPAAGTPAGTPAGAQEPPTMDQPFFQPEENTSSYDHLWDKTVMRNIEDAAVRVDPEDDEDAGPGHRPASVAFGAQVLPADESDILAGAVREAPAAPAEAPSAAALAAVEPPAAGSPAAGPSAQAAGGLIDSVPWSTGGSSAPARQAPAQAPVQQPAWLPPVHAAVPAPPPASPQGVPPVQGLAAAPESAPERNEDPGYDHDGQTIVKSSLGTMDTVSETPSQAAGQGNGPTVLARVCPQGHANPPTYSQCAACGLALPGDGHQVPRPRLGRVRLSTGDVIDLDQSLIIGRQPSVSRVQGGVMPRLVQVGSPGGDISRSHVEVRLEGWHVMLCDLKATNGTVLVREGQAPRRLAQSEMAILLDGDIAELGDNISLRFEEIL